MMKKVSVILALFFTTLLFSYGFGPAYAAPGDIIFQCNFDGSGSSPGDIWSKCGNGAGSGNILNDVGSIGSGDGPNGKYLKINVNGFKSAISQYAVDAPFYIHRNYPKETTIVYWEKIYSNTGAIPKANIKSIRQLYGKEYMGAIIGLHYDNYFYQSTWEKPAQLIPTNKVTYVEVSDGYCTKNDDGTYTCPKRMRLKWTPNYTDKNWHKVRLYLKMPSSEDSSDGQTKVWIDDQLIYTLNNLAKVKNGISTTTSIVFAPSDAGGVPYTHSYDEITVYDGYMPPNTDGNEGSESNRPSPPSFLEVK